MPVVRIDSGAKEDLADELALVADDPRGGGSLYLR